MLALVSDFISSWFNYLAIVEKSKILFIPRMYSAHGSSTVYTNKTNGISTVRAPTE